MAATPYPVLRQVALDTVDARSPAELSRELLDHQHARALRLGARLLVDRSDDSTEQLRVYADPTGHPFCIFVQTH
jgi:hypothetical protein